MDTPNKHDHQHKEDERAMLWTLAREQAATTRCGAMLWISGMPTMYAAVLWFFICGFFARVLIQALSMILSETGCEAFVWPARIVIAAGWLGVWAWLLAKAWKHFEAMTGVWLALLMHPILIGLYGLSVWGFICGILLLGEGLVTLNTYYCAVGLGSLAISAVSYWFGLRGLRYVAAHCRYRNLNSFSLAYDASMAKEVKRAIRS